MLVAGIDGTKHGWVAVALEGNGVRGFYHRTLSGLITELAGAEAIGLDMPIGFPDVAEQGGRECERLARRELPGRASCVFNSPCRSALDHDDYPAASAANRASGPALIGLSKQSFALFPKMRETDSLVVEMGQERLFEVHPEVSFAHLASTLNAPIQLPPKKTVAGALCRLDLLRQVGIAAEPLLSRARRLRAGEDDILDATVAAWTARRRAAGTAVRLPQMPERDSRGLWMEIWA